MPNVSPGTAREVLPRSDPAGTAGSMGPVLGGDDPILPDYDGGCLSNVVPALLDVDGHAPPWMPTEAAEANQVVLLLLDGLGWNQLVDRWHLAPNLAAMHGGPITSVAPTTTATALTSVSTGLAPGEHGIVGYRMALGSEVLNVLRWSTDRDARKKHPPEAFAVTSPFGGHRPPVVTKAEFERSGFTSAHLSDTRFRGYRTISGLVHEVGQIARDEPFAYAYYDGIDKVSHAYGLGAHFDAEVSFADRLVGDVFNTLPRGAALVVTADHGQVDTGGIVTELDPSVMANVSMQSGEGRFRWLHARGGRDAALLKAAAECHGDEAWVHSKAELVEEGWFGPVVTAEASARLGDVALVAKGTATFHDPADSGPYELIGRHGSMTADEIYVPLLARTR